MKRVATALLLAFALPATAAEYLLASLVSDRITIIHAGAMMTGSNLDNNRYQVVATPQVPFDDAIQAAIAEAVTKKDPEAKFKGLAFREGLPGVDAAKDAPADVARKLAAALAPVLKAGERQWIVAVLPFVTDVRLRSSARNLGRGRAGGVGYLLDRNTVIIEGDKSNSGFLGGWANFRVVLVDPSSGAIVAESLGQHGVINPVVSNVGEKAINPWDAVSADDKLEMINNVLSSELRRAMPALVEKLGR
jgi:hypothetical protein